MWPWICFVPAAIWHFWQDRGAGSEAEMVPDERSYRSSAHLLFWWFAIILVFFSIPRAKLGSYILPALPPLAILAGYALCRFRLVAAWNRRLLFGTIALVNAAALIGAVVARANLDAGLARVLLSEAIAGIGILAAASFISLMILWRGDGLAAGIGVLCLGLLAALGISLTARIDAQPLGSYRQLAREIAPYLGPDCRLASYRHFVQSLPFYTGHRETLVDYRGELAPFARSPEAHGGFIATDAELARVWHGAECVVLVINRRDLERAQAILGRDATVIGCEGKKLALYNRESQTDAAARCKVDWPAREPLGFTAR
jgi:4-amino-4-deoxy-L-arabinose transferase-like glycosyltransferase